MILYKLIYRLPNILEFKLIHLASKVINYMEDRKIFMSSKGVIISYIGSKLILEDNEGSSVDDVSIIIPTRDRLIGNRNLTAYKSFRSLTDLSAYSQELCNAFGELSHQVHSFDTQNKTRGSPRAYRTDPYLIVLSKEDRNPVWYER